MGIYRRGRTWWVRFTDPGGREIRRSAGTTKKRQAQEFHDRLRAEQWRQAKLGEKPKRTWQEAVVRWMAEREAKVSIEDDRHHLRRVNPYLRDKFLDQIDRSLLELITQKRLETGVSNGTVNRMLEVVRAILRAAARDWEWIDTYPQVRMLSEGTQRVRWLTSEEAERLLATLPSHLRDMARFTLATGLRESNVTHLEWSQVNMDRRRAWIHAYQSKSRKAIAVPLNDDAMQVLHRQRGKHPTRVFAYGGKPIRKANGAAWRKALRRAGITDFRWHDLRHTWASWHVQRGTPLYALQQLGGWSDYKMVARYAHLSSDHLAEHAARLSLADHAAKMSTGGQSSGTKSGTVAESQESSEEVSA